MWCKIKLIFKIKYFKIKYFKDLNMFLIFKKKSNFAIAFEKYIVIVFYNLNFFVYVPYR